MPNALAFDEVSVVTVVGADYLFKADGCTKFLDVFLELVVAIRSGLLH